MADRNLVVADTSTDNSLLEGEEYVSTPINESSPDHLSQSLRIKRWQSNPSKGIGSFSTHNFSSAPTDMMCYEDDRDDNPGELYSHAPKTVKSMVVTSLGYNNDKEFLIGDLIEYERAHDLQTASSFLDPQQYPEMAVSTESDTSSYDGDIKCDFGQRHYKIDKESSTILTNSNISSRGILVPFQRLSEEKLITESKLQSSVSARGCVTGTKRDRDTPDTISNNQLQILTDTDKTKLYHRSFSAHSIDTFDTIECSDGENWNECNTVHNIDGTNETHGKKGSWCISAKPTLAILSETINPKEVIHDDPEGILQFLPSGESSEGIGFGFDDVTDLSRSVPSPCNKYFYSGVQDPCMPLGSSSTTPKTCNVVSYTVDRDLLCRDGWYTKKTMWLETKGIKVSNKRVAMSSRVAIQKVASYEVYDIYNDVEINVRTVDMNCLDDDVSFVTTEIITIPNRNSPVPVDLPYDKAMLAQQQHMNDRKIRNDRDEQHAVFRKVVLPCLVLLAVSGMVVGSVCGLGHCVVSTETGAATTPQNLDGGTSTDSSSRRFTSTAELYAAVDAYLTDMNGDRLAMDSGKSMITEQFGDPIGIWDVSQITDFTQLFDTDRDPTYSARSRFNEDISQWNVSAALSMRGMFRNTILFNQELDMWDVSNVKDMSYMFHNAPSFNQNLSLWDVGSVQSMAYIFKEAVSFNGNVSTWNVGNVQDMNSMFARAISFNSDLSRWDVSSVVDMSYMFNRASAFEGDVSLWDVSRVLSMQVMFQRAQRFTSDVSKWNVSNCMDMKYMFYGAVSFNSSLAEWNVSKVTDMFSMFNQASTFNSNLSTWDVSNVVDMDSMFQLATSFDGDLSKWNVSKCINMAYMFFGARSFNSNISEWNVESVQTMHRMFRHAVKFNQDLSTWKVSNLVDLSYMFANASSFNQALCSWGKILVSSRRQESVDVSNMFEATNCPSMTSPEYFDNGLDGPWCHVCV